jgi:SAM-dependent methyltransferase
MAFSNFDQLADEALAQDFSGWDFSWLHGRWHEEEPSWNYRELVQSALLHAESLLDMGTGGGEFLASLSGRPAMTFATESYAPNIPIARARLEPLGVKVLAIESDEALPLPDRSLDLAINRHESYWIPELLRILKPGGTFLTQQVGALDCIQINEFLNAPTDSDAAVWMLENEIRQLEEAGFQILRAEEAFLDSIFDDIGAVVFFLKIIGWQIPDFSIEKYRDRLLAMNEQIKDQGPFHAKAHRFLIKTQKR